MYRNAVTRIAPRTSTILHIVAKTFEQPLVQVAITGHNRSVRRHNVAPYKVSDPTAGLAHDDQSGGNVPRREPQLPERVEATACQPRQVERGTPRAPNA